MLSIGSIRLKQDITAARRGSVATDHVAAFVPGAYAIFVWTQLMVHIPPLTEFDPFAEVKELDEGQGAAPVQGSDTTVVADKPEHRPGASFSFILDHTGQTAYGKLEMHLMSPYWMSSPDCTHRASMVPPASRDRGTQCGGHASRGAGRRPVIVEETEEASSDDSGTTTSNMF
ncbi:hypothetical protein JCGZ_03923 [Jatropha curcas]|uniref:Uncharacterized protein n=1 Tax=Jatropha curcas TaxID=180498 RepID=A0A067LQA0_JATCU|nr:hypothetical protein JCGZ_03923 [Jatropha curcas]